MGNLITQNLPPFKDLSISKLSPLSNREAVALYDFNSESPGTLCVGAGEKLEIVCEMHAWRVKEEGSGWVVVRSLSGAEGYVPKAFLNLYVENLELNDGNPGRFVYFVRSLTQLFDSAPAVLLRSFIGESRRRWRRLFGGISAGFRKETVR